jgi:hypothetical protein
VRHGADAATTEMTSSAAALPAMTSAEASDVTSSDVSLRYEVIAAAAATSAVAALVLLIATSACLITMSRYDINVNNNIISKNDS